MFVLIGSCHLCFAFSVWAFAIIVKKWYDAGRKKESREWLAYSYCATTKGRNPPTPHSHPHFLETLSNCSQKQAARLERLLYCRQKIIKQLARTLRIWIWLFIPDICSTGKGAHRKQPYCCMNFSHMFYYWCNVHLRMSYHCWLTRSRKKKNLMTKQASTSP